MEKKKVEQKTMKTDSGYAEMAERIPKDCQRIPKVSLTVLWIQDILNIYSQRVYLNYLCRYFESGLEEAVWLKVLSVVI